MAKIKNRKIKMLMSSIPWHGVFTYKGKRHKRIVNCNGHNAMSVITEEPLRVKLNETVIFHHIDHTEDIRFNDKDQVIGKGNRPRRRASCI